MILTSFGGIVPRLADHKLSINQATVAHDCRLRDGRLESWREPCQFAAVVGGARTIHLYGCCPLSWEDKVNVAELTPDWGRFYITGRKCGAYLESGIVDTCCGVEYYVRVGTPAPMSPPSASGKEECGMEADARAYVYTYVNSWEEESPPSPPSNVIRVNDGASVTVSGIAPPPEDYSVVAVNIYRLATGFRPPDGKVQKPLTDYQLVARIPAGQTTYTDTVASMFLGPVLETQYDRPPPEMAGIVSISDQVRLAGFNKNRVFLSEPHQPWNWPSKYDLTLDYHIVHMLCLDQRLFVTTDSIPYLIDVSSCEEAKCSPVTALDLPLPDIGCHYSHGAIMTHHGMFYASPFGIVLLQPTGAWHIVTSRWFGQREWLKLRPDTIRMAYWEGYLFFATDMATFLLDVNGKPYDDMDGAELVTLSDRPVDLVVSDTGKLVLLQDGAMWIWDGGTRYRPYIWESKIITARSLAGQSRPESAGPVRDYHWWPTSVKLGGSAQVTIRDEHDHVIFDRTLARERPHRVRRTGRHLGYRLRLSGIDPVEFISIGTSNNMVNRGE